MAEDVREPHMRPTAAPRAISGVVIGKIAEKPGKQSRASDPGDGREDSTDADPLPACRPTVRVRSGKSTARPSSNTTNKAGQRRMRVKLVAAPPSPRWKKR